MGIFTSRRGRPGSAQLAVPHADHILLHHPSSTCQAGIRSPVTDVETVLAREIHG
jgi:hypothetical protein